MSEWVELKEIPEVLYQTYLPWRRPKNKIHINRGHAINALHACYVRLYSKYSYKFVPHSGATQPAVAKKVGDKWIKLELKKEFKSGELPWEEINE